MSMNTDIPGWMRRINEIKQELAELGEMRPGSISEQYNVCGKATCVCKDPENPKKHGPYYQLSYTHQGRGRTEFVSKERVDEVRQQLERYRSFRALTKEWVDLSVMIAKQRKERKDR